MLQVIIGPRQVGKTTLALQVFKNWPGPKSYNSADLPNTPTIDWVVNHWEQCRLRYRQNKREGLLILDEIQKIPRWSEAVKKLYDEDKVAKRRIRVVLLGSSSLLVQKGLTESLAGRFEIHRHYHWSYNECHEYFRLNLNEYLYFGGFPGALLLRKDENRWGKYIRDSLIETVLSKDVLLMTPVTKPALLRQAFGLCLAHPAEIVSYQKMIGQLQDAGNTTTIAFYLRLLANAFLLAPLEKYSGSRIKQRGSTPKILVLDNSLIIATVGQGFKETMKNKAFRGRLLENAVGAKIYSLLQELGGELFYWRERDNEVDYVVKLKNRLIAIEVKSSNQIENQEALEQFAKRYPAAEKVLIQANAESEDKQRTELRSCKMLSINDFFNNPRLAIEI